MGTRTRNKRSASGKLDERKLSAKYRRNRRIGRRERGDQYKETEKQ